MMAPRGKIAPPMRGSFIFAALALAAAIPASAQIGEFFSNWPAGTSPQEVGKHLSEHFVSSPHQYTATIH